MSDYKTVNKYKTKKSSKPGRTVNTQYNPPKGQLDEQRRRNMLIRVKRNADSTAARSREAAMGDKNISYVGDPFVVDGKKFDPAKKFPETYMRPEGAKTFKKGGMARGGGAAIKGTKFQGVF
jgi:hypothetical protein